MPFEGCSFHLACRLDRSMSCRVEKEIGSTGWVGVCEMEQFLVLNAGRTAARWIEALARRKNRERSSFCKTRLANYWMEIV